MKKLFGFLLVLMLALGCANVPFVEQSADFIETANFTVDALMKHLGDEYRAGRLSDDEKCKVIEVYAQYKLASDFADEALAAYAREQTSGNHQAYLQALSVMLNNQEALIGLANALLGGE